MYAKNFTLEEVFSLRQQWVVPVYQRDYAWSSEPNEQLPQIWEDIQERAEELMEGRDLSPHFVGAIIYADPNEPQPFGAVSQRLIVDGQQRITTCKLLLCAVREIARDSNLLSIASSVSPYLFNSNETVMVEPDREYHKLWLSSVDRDYYILLSQGGMRSLRNKYSGMFDDNGKLNAKSPPNIISAYCYLVSRIRDYIDSDQNSAKHATVLSNIIRGILSGIQLVVVQLGNNDDPQSIYASLNEKAKPLSAFDLIRNDIFHRASKSQEDEKTLYENHWKFFEDPFWKESVKQGRLKRPRSDHLMAHTLIAEMAKKIDAGKVAKEYQNYSKNQDKETVKEEVIKLLRYADVYLALEKQDDSKPEYQISKFLKIWELSAFHPLILWIGNQKIGIEIKKKVYYLLESYIIRRDMRGLSRQNYNNVIPSILRSLKNGEADGILSGVIDGLLSHKAKSSIYPRDADLIGSASENYVYTNLSSAKIRYILYKIEQGIHNTFNETVTYDLEKLSVEHIMPQKWEDNWPLPEGISEEEMISRRNRLLHTVGNLTILSISQNSRNSNSGWKKKKDMLQKDSRVLLNRQLCNATSWKEWNQVQDSLDDWNEESIVERNKYLYEKIAEIWPMPTSPNLRK